MPPLIILIPIIAALCSAVAGAFVRGMFDAALLHLRTRFGRNRDAAQLEITKQAAQKARLVTLKQKLELTDELWNRYEEQVQENIAEKAAHGAALAAIKGQLDTCLTKLVAVEAELHAMKGEIEARDVRDAAREAAHQQELALRDATITGLRAEVRALRIGQVAEVTAAKATEAVATKAAGSVTGTEGA